MKFIRFGKYTGDDLGIDAEDLMRALSDFFLESGFNSQYSGYSEFNPNSLEDLKDAIRRALESGQMFPDDRMQEMLEKLSAMSPEQIDKLVETPAAKARRRGPHLDRPAKRSRSRLRSRTGPADRSALRGHR